MRVTPLKICIFPANWLAGLPLNSPFSLQEFNPTRFQSPHVDGENTGRGGQIHSEAKAEDGGPDVPCSFGAVELEAVRAHPLSPRGGGAFSLAWSGRMGGASRAKQPPLCTSSSFLKVNKSKIFLGNQFYLYKYPNAQWPAQTQGKCTDTNQPIKSLMEFC